MFTRVPPRVSVAANTPLPAGFQPGVYDVICSRGRVAYNHAGNINFRQLIDEHLEEYTQAATRAEKSILIISIVAITRRRFPNGGFVRYCKKSRCYFDIGDARAREKVGHAFREASSANNNVEVSATRHHSWKKPSAASLAAPSVDTTDLSRHREGTPRQLTLAQICDDASSVNDIKVSAMPRSLKPTASLASPSVSTDVSEHAGEVAARQLTLAQICDEASSVNDMEVNAKPQSWKPSASLVAPPAGTDESEQYGAVTTRQLTPAQICDDKPLPFTSPATRDQVPLLQMFAAKFSAEHPRETQLSSTNSTANFSVPELNSAVILVPGREEGGVKKSTENDTNQPEHTK